MKKMNSKPLLMAVLSIVLTILACSLPGVMTSGGQETPKVASSTPPATSTKAPLATAGAANPLPTFVVDTPTPALAHVLVPSTVEVKPYKHIYDVV
jgi:hypothetical protein